MKLLRNGLIAAAGLAALATSLFSPVVPSSGAYTFTATNNGTSCEVRPEGRQSAYFVLKRNIIRQSNSTYDRVVRIYSDFGAGTGYLIGSSFVLTASHVVNKGEPTTVLGDGTSYQGRVLQIDPEADLGLVKLLSPENKSPPSIKIGDVKKSGNAVVRTLNPKDWHYKDGLKSQMEVKIIRYDGLLLPGTQQAIAELGKQKEGLEFEIEQLDGQINALIEPYIDKMEKTTSPKATKNTAENASKTDRINPNSYSYAGRTESDQFSPGMSGSAIFNQAGELVGVARSVSGYFSLTITVYGRLPNLPESVLKQVEEIKGRIQTIDDTLSSIKEQTYRLENPDNYKAVSPQAIVDFLKNACLGTARN